MKKNGQSVMEYLLLVAAVMVVCIAFLGPGGPMHTAVDKIIADSVNLVNRLANETNILP